MSRYAFGAAPTTLRLVLGGLKSLIPGAAAGYRGAVDATSGEYCYAVWLRHLLLVSRAVPKFRARTVLELGPGDSLGVGCAALLSGADRYIGLDVVAHARPEHDVRVLDEVVRLFERRSRIPDHKTFPGLHPRLKSYAFPSRSFTDDGPRSLRLDHERVESIRAALLGRSDVLYDDVPLGYLVPWTQWSVDRESVDLVITQATLQDIAHGDRTSDLAASIAAMARWVRTGGVMSHQIDLSFADGAEWNSHWRYPDAAWRVVRGARPFFPNRVPFSEYLALIEANGFTIRAVQRVEQEGLPRERVASRFRTLPEEDFRTAGAHVVAVKR